MLPAFSIDRTKLSESEIEISKFTSLQENERKVFNNLIIKYLENDLPKIEVLLTKAILNKT